MMSRIRTAVLLAIATIVAAPAMHAQKLTPDEVVLRGYALTMPKVEAWATASIELANTMKAMPAAEKARRKAEMEAQPDEGDNETIAGMATRMERIPEVRRAFRKAGLTSREAVTLSLALMQAVMFNQIAAANPDAKIPYNVNPANITFVRKNKAQLEARMKAVQEASKEADDEKPSDEPSPDDPEPGEA